MVCEQKRQLLADYLERTQALAVEAELLLDALGKDREEGLELSLEPGGTGAD